MSVASSDVRSIMGGDFGTHERIHGFNREAFQCAVSLNAVFITLIATLAIMLVPCSLDISIEENELNPSEIKLNVEVTKNEANAIAPAFAGASAFLEEASLAAGFASTGDFVATGAGLCAVGSGLAIGTDAGIKYGNSLHANLQALVDAADYPNWSTLSQAEKEQWGTEDNYSAAKFNSFLAAFGMGEDYERYQNSWGNLQPGEFTFSSSATSTLEQIGDIGSNWIAGIPNKFEDIKDLFTPDYVHRMNAWYGVDSFKTFDGSNVSGYPNDLATSVIVCKGNLLQIEYQGAIKFRLFSTSPETYWIVTVNGVNYSYKAFSKSSFMYGTAMVNNDPSAPTPTSNSRTANFEGNTYYVTNGNGYGDQLVSVNMRYNLLGNLQDWQYTEAAPYILFSDQLNGLGDLEPDIPEYPGVSEIDDNQELYYPTEGINQDTTWTDLNTEPEPTPEPVVRPSNPFNPDNQTGTPEWREDAEDNLIPLAGIHFDQLFPFSLIFDIPRLSTKINSFTESSQESYLTLTIPLMMPTDEPGSETELELDLTDLASLALMIRPFFQILLAASLLIVTIKFWQGILTG